VNVTVTDSDGVDGVWVEYWFDSGNKTNVSLSHIGGDYWELDNISIPSDSDDDLYYNISANDTYDVWGHLDNQQVNISDDDSPYIANVSAMPSATSQGGYINITCMVADNMDIDTVKVNISGPASFTSVNISMLEGSYYYNTTYTIAGVYNYFIWVDDISGNSNMSTDHSFSINASDAPAIVNNTPDGAGTGDSFVVNVTVTDSDGVDGVWVEYWFDSGNKTNVSLSHIGGDYWELDNISIPSDSDDDLYYNISANDTYDVWGHLDNQQVNISDDDSPVLSNITASPAEQETSEYVNITYNVSDNVGIDTVKVNISGPASFASVNTTMPEGSYYYNNSYKELGTYNYFIWVNDSSGNVNISTVYNFSIYTLSAFIDDDFNESTQDWGVTNFSNIQDGVDTVKENGTVFVFNGTYHENLEINKTIDLIGENKNTTVIESNAYKGVISVSADLVNVTGFTITGSVNSQGIKLSNVQNCSIFDNNIIFNDNNGIELLGSNNNEIYNNSISFNVWGIVSTNSYYNNISSNTLSFNSASGIRLWYSFNNIIYNNYFNNPTPGDNAWDNGYNFWNTTKAPGTNIINGSFIGGNYWSDYEGVDNNPRDGLGDSPYRNIGGSNEDKYPLYFNATPVINNENPRNEATNVSLQPDCSITAFDSDTESLNVFFYESNNNSWTLKHSCSVNSGSTAIWNNYSNATVYSRLYSWSVNVTDGYSWINETYHFTTQRPDVVYIDDNNTEGPWNGTSDYPYQAIQDGIDAVSTGGTIYVHSGTYNENVLVNKTVDLIGEDRDYTIIDGGSIGDVLYVSSEGVNISGFTITNSGDSGSNAGIYMHSNQSIIYGNNISNNNYGIYLSGSSYNIIYNNFISNTNNAYDDGSNTWNDTVYGNYWSDYTGVDSNGDGIGDIPYDISGGDNNDYYPLVNQSDNYFTLSITAPSSVNEGKKFTVTIKNLLNEAIQDANVTFDIKTEIKTEITASNGQVNFSAPNVGSNTVYTITVIKTGYYGDSTTIIVKNIPSGGDGDDNGDDDYVLLPEELKPTNQKPVADASASETFGFAGTPIIFDGSNSYDPDEDGYIASGYWNFGDGTNFTAKIVAHTYSNPGTYTVTLTVTDNNGTTDTCEITVVISQANRPPTTPVIKGHTNGSKNTEYIYTAISTDLDDHDVRYVFDWDDVTDNTITSFVGNGTIGNATHIWKSAGVYLLRTYAEDKYNSTSGATELMILIDVQVKFIDDVVDGYLIDYERDGTYDAFHNNLTRNDTDIELQENGRYLIDINQNGTWDYTYDPMTGMINFIKEKKTIEKIEIPWVLVVGIILIIVIIILFKRGYLSIEEIPPDEKKKKRGGKNNKKGKN